jgi:rubredoxin
MPLPRSQPVYDLELTHFVTKEGDAMTIICMDCKRVIGEKCPKCGSHRKINEGGFFLCSYCELWFREGEGGISHGLCPERAAKREAANQSTTETSTKGVTQ